MAEELPGHPPVPVPPAPETPREEIIDLLHGVRVPDPYRWLEAGDDPRVRAWDEAQTRRTRAVLDALPWRPALRRRLEELYAAGAVGGPRLAGGRLFFLRRRPGAPQPALVVRPAAGGTEAEERLLVDPSREDERGLVAIDWWYPSPDGRLVAFGLSAGGDEWSTLHVVEVESGRRLEEAIPRTPHASLAWEPDGGGFYYTRHPDPAEVGAEEAYYHPRLYHHRLGRPAEEDEPVFGADLPREAMLEVALSPSGRFLLAVVQLGWSRNELWMAERAAEGTEARPDAPRFVPLVRGQEALFQARFTPAGWGGAAEEQLLVLTNLGAPRYRLLRVAAAEALAGRPVEEWTELLPEPGAGTLAGFAPVRRGVAVLVLEDAVSRLWLLPAGGGPRHELGLPPLASVAALEGEADPSAPEGGPELVALVESFLRPPAVWRLGPEGEALERWIGPEAPFDEEAFVARQAFCTSRDGTRIPVFLVHRRDLPRDGRRPAVLTGYGGFGVSMTPQYRPQVIPWLEAGGLWAMACLRGGGEYGEGWHQAGMLGNKTNVFDDFVAAAEFLIRARYTSPERLGAFGRSNGGLLTGAALTRRPDLWRAVVSGVPLLDMLRYHRFRIAALWIPEYGSADDPEAFRWLWGYSPYHRVREGRRYPAVLLYAAESDTRVDPLHARKMAARLQEVTGQAGAAAPTAPERPVLLRLEAEAGHGAGKPVQKVIEEEADIWSFLGWQLGLPLGLPAGGETGVERA